MGGILATILGLPKWAHVAMGCAALGLAFLIWLKVHDSNVIEDYERDITHEVEKKAGEAADDAGVAVTDTQDEVEQGNDEARKAADGSDDPLRDALDSLRP